MGASANCRHCFLVVNGKTELVNFRVDGSRYIVDRLFDKAVLVVGVGKKQTRVTITRETPYSQTERRTDDDQAR
jgi:type IV secretory pathway VirB9-like protein